MTDEHERVDDEYERGDYLHARDLTPEMIREVNAALLGVFASRDICPECGAAMMRRFAQRMAESWNIVGTDYTCMH